MKHLKKSMCVFLSFVLTFSSVQVVPSHAVAVDELTDASTEPLTVEPPAPAQPASEVPVARPAEGPTATPEKTPENVSQWQALQRMFDEAQDAATIVLDADYTADANDAGLEIPASKSITLDLAGHTLNRNLVSPKEDGHVILVRGSLSVVDSTATAGVGGKGTITGGKTLNGGGIVVDAGASLRLECGTITGNEAENGGGIFVGPDATLHLAGGIISGNTARGPGGGVLVDSGAKAVIVEGAPVVRSNTANGSGADVFLPEGFVLTMGEAISSEAEVGIALEQGTGTFTSGYATSYGDKDPGDFFTAADGLEVSLSDGEAQVIAPVANQTEASGEAKGNGSKTLSVRGTSPDSGTRGVPLTTNAEGDIVVDSEEALRNAISSATEGQTIVLSADITTGGTLAVVRPGVSFAIDLAGHTINRNLTEQDEDNNGHVLDVNQGTLTIRDSSAEQTGKITGGFDENGGGVVIGGEGTLNLESGSITGNQGVDGGGVFVYGTMNMTGGSVSGNSGERGGGIFCKGRVAATGGSVSNNIGGDAGGIYVDGGTIDFTDVSVTGNTATVAGGGGVNNKGYTVLKSCTVSNNSATLAGGGAYNEGELHLSNCTISDNKTADSGGAVSTRNTTTIDGCTLTNNTAAVDGGALYFYGCTTSLTSDTTLNANKAEASGGAIRIYGGVVELDHATLNKNEATWYGGGIYCNNDGSFKLLNGTSITENIGYKGGGGAYVENQTTEVQVGSGVVVKDNQANNIYLTGDRRLTVVEELGEGTQIGVALQNLGGTFTANFNATNPNTDPSSVFVPEPGYSILRDGEGEARVVTSDWVGLQALIDKAAESGQPIILDRNWQAVDENAALVIPEGKIVSIDLNGYKIDRHRSSYAPDGEVFTVNGTLSLADNSYDKKGAVTGGHGDVGGIRVNSGGTLKLNSGTIKGNHAKVTGGGVYVAEGGLLETYGGAISSNISDGDGGGVYCGGTFANSECSISNNAAGSVDGSSSLGSGGGIFVTGAAAVTINSGTISSNKANNMGGGIYQNGGTLTVNDGSTPVSIASNSANSDGGGIYVATGTATINAGEITSNSTRGSGGGAFLVEGATLNLYDVSVTDNYAAGDGGGVYNNKGTFGVKGSPRVTGNVGTIGKNVLLAPDSVVTIEDALVKEGDTPARLDVQTQGYGQAITSGFTEKGCSIECFTLNDADNSHPQVQEDGELHIIAGSVAVEVGSWDELQAAFDNPPQPGPTTAPLIIGLKNDISADDDDDNLSVDHGDAIGVTLDLRGHVLNRNLGDSEGGDGHVLEVDNNSSLTIIDSVGTGIITGGYADNGGAIYIHEGSSVKIQGGTIRDNRATSDGGGIYACGTFEMTGGSIVRNEAEDNGGGIYASEGGNLDLKMANISSNTSGNEGGGLDVRVSKATLWNCSVRNNTAKDDDGGGINVDKSDLLLKIEETDIVGNVSNQEHRGGGIFLNDGRIEVKGGAISDNYASDGGGIFNNECAITLDGTTLSGNRTGKSGGAGISNGGSCQLANCTFSGNIAEGEGGGIFTSGDDYLTASECTFSGNESADASGGAICTYRATTLTNCTFTGNKAHYNGGAVCVHGDVTIDGGTISGNEATEYGGGIVANEDGTLRLLGKTADLQITKNSAALSGSGVYVSGNTHYVSVGGKVTVLENEMDSDFFMAGDKCLDVVDGIDGSQIRMALERGAGQFTINLASHATGVDPATFFLAPAGMSVIPTADGEAQLAASDWPTLQKMIDETADGATLTLDRDWKAAPQNVSLKIAQGKNITIDLAGHTIDRARTEYEAAGEVFSVEGSLTVTDSSEGAAGKVCGAYGDGGGIVVRNGGTLNFQSGNISGNKAKTGAGVLVNDGGKFNMGGGSITGNHADSDGGGVYVYSRGETSITGGAITYNEASGSAGGMRAAGTLSIGGTLKIVDNIGPQSANLLLASNTVMNVSQQLKSSARVDFVAESPSRALTLGLTSSQSDGVVQTVFTYDKATDRLEVRDGELYLSQSQDVVTVSDWQALRNAISDEANRDKVIRLANDITAGEDDDRLLLDGKSVIVDLNGHALNRNLSDDDDDGHVFELSGNSTLTIRDTAGAGRITGGYAVHGGAINIHEGCTCNVEGGTFCGNRASEEGGAFFVYGTLNVRGGMITQNSAESGGAIFVHENGTVNIENIAIVNNEATKWGGGAINNKGNATLTNCVIKNNWADNEGGGIYNGDKQLTLNNCTVTNNSSSAGGGLCCYGTANINDTTISSNYGDDYGGGLFMRGIVTISDSHITGNTGKTDGGGIHNLGGLLTATGTDISSNSTEAGGGALNNKGTATLTSCTMSNNHANAEGGGIYAGIDSGTTIDGCTLQGNSAGGDGGAMAAYGVMTVANSTISKNTTDAGGAGLYSYGDTTITNTTITENKAKQSGGGLLARTRTLTLENATVTKNTASNLGGGLMVEGGSDAVVIKGAVTIKDNNGSGDVYLSDGKLLTVGGALENDTGATSMGVRTQNGVGVVFTSGYSNDNSGKEPATYFTSNDGYLVYLEGTEASTKKETLDDNSFVEPGSQINRNNGQLTGVNWMSGISGERRINEINIPGTHDSGTKAVLPNLTTGYLMELAAWIDSPIGALVSGLVLPPVALISMLDPGLISGKLSEYAATFANCQTRYIDELLEDGIRHLDFRLNTYCVAPGWPPNPKSDNGEDLYLCHGKNEKVGTFYAYDERTSSDDVYNFITFKRALSWIKTFLEEHPTETLTMAVAIESVDDVYDEGMARIRKHLHEELATQINPSTGKPYLYMEDGVFGKKLTEYPQLKDCRGQVILECSAKDVEILGGAVKEDVVSRVIGPDGNFEETAGPKIAHLRQFFADHGYDDLPSTAKEAIDYLYFVGLNGTDPSSIPMVTPLQIAEDVLEAMFGENGLVIDKVGKYIGRINMDGENAEYSKIVWSSNFFDTLQYCKVTTKSGMNDDVAQTSYILYGTMLPIPECIYNNPNSEGKYFQYWEAQYDNSVSGNVYQFYPGEEFGITGDITFTAKWGEQQQTPVRVVWHDAENADKLRPDKLSITAGGTNVDIQPTKNWRVYLPGNVVPGDITVNWDKIGVDTEGQYACEVREHESGYGIVIELTHTPQKQIQAKGTVRWVDRDDAAGKRPENVTVHLLADSRVIDSVTTTAENDWAWDLGERPVFVDGQKVNYSVDEDPVDGYVTYTKSSEDTGFEITNVLGGAKQSTNLTGLVYWTDNDNAGSTRPRSVTINLFRDGEKIDTREVAPDKSGYWVIDFEVPGSINDASYRITEEPVEGYKTTVIPMENTGGMLLVSNILEGHEHKHKTVSGDMLKPTCTEVGLHRTIEYCEECGELFSDVQEDISALGHDWGDWQKVIEATETRMGLETRTCKRDKTHTQSRVVPMTGHVHGLTHVAAKAATCTEDGNTEYWTCTEGENPCGLRFADAAGTEWVHEEATVVHALGHDWGAWEVTQEPTEVSPGIERRVCSHDSAHVEVRMIPKKNHVHGLTHVAAKAATCTEDGNIEYWKCTKGEDPCGMCFRDAAGTDWVHEEGTVEHATGHDWGEWRITKPATESEKGEMVRVCHNDFTHTQTRAIPKVGHIHSFVRVAAKPATCTEDGNIEYWKCTEGDDPCGLCFRDPAGGEWVHEEALVIHALGHVWGEPTYEWGEGDATVTATRVCLRDPSHTEQETVAAGAITYVQPTCTEPGKATVISQPFANPGFLPQSKSGQDVPALGHVWGEWVVTKPATETEEGQETRTCARCGETETRAIPARIAYSYVGPDGQAWTKGGAEALTFTFKRSFADELTFGLFAGVEVDDRAVPEKDASGRPNYTVESGSLILHLQPSFLESLAEGDHKVTTLFKDGSASAMFAVKAASREGQKEEDQKKETNDGGTGDNVTSTGNLPTGGANAGTSNTGGTGSSTSSTQSTRTSTPQTGDTSFVIACAAMAVLVILALGAFALANKKRGR